MNKMLQNYLSRHWHLTLVVLAISAVALFKHLISGTDWSAIATCLVGAFRAGDVLDSWVHNRQNGGSGDKPC